MGLAIGSSNMTWQIYSRRALTSLWFFVSFYFLKFSFCFIYYARPAVAWYSSLSCRPEYAREIWKSVFTLKAHQMFFVHITKFKKFIAQKSPVILDLSLKRNSEERSHDYCDVTVFANLHFQFFSVHNKTQERFRKALFSWWISVGSKPHLTGKTYCNEFIPFYNNCLKWIRPSSN